MARKIPNARTSLSDLCIRLSDIDLLTPEDIETMAPEKARALLDAVQPGPRRSAHDFLDRALKALDAPEVQSEARTAQPEFAHSIFEDDRIASDDSWIVRRDGLVQELANGLAKERMVVVSGAAGAGKSTFFRHCFRRDERYRKDFDAAILVDCYALRGQSIRALERDAVAMQFGDDEHGFQSFLLNEARDDRPLQSLIQSKLSGRKGLLVLDHVECLTPNGEIANWLGELERAGTEAGARMVWLSRPLREMNCVSSFLSSKQSLEIHHLVKSEIAAWLSQRRYAPFVEAGLRADRLHALTGGVPRIVRDFGRFLAACEEKEREPEGLLQRFQARMQSEFAPEVERALSCFEQTPWLLDEPLKAPKRYRHALLDTGCFASSGSGQFTFAGDLLERRFRTLVSNNGMSLKLMTGNDDRSAKVLAGIQEVLAGGLLYALSLDEEPTSVWRRHVSFIGRLGLSDIRLHARDVANSKVWKQLYAEKRERRQANRKPWPLYADSEPLFAQAVRIGRIVTDEEGNVVIPMIGTDGRTSLMIQGQYSELPENDFERRLVQRRLWHFAKATERAVARSVEIAESRRAVAHWRKVTYRLGRGVTERSGSDFAVMTEEAGCEAVVVFQWGYRNWKIRAIDVPVNEQSGASLSKDMLEFFHPGALDDIARHRSRRGLVLAGARVRELFPRLQPGSADLAAFAWPVPGEPLRIVTFVFAGAHAAELAGASPLHLQIVANRAASRVVS